jgi:hypothetical protein
VTPRRCSPAARGPQLRAACALMQAGKSAANLSRIRRAHQTGRQSWLRRRMRQRPRSGARRDAVLRHLCSVAQMPAREALAAAV